MKKYLYLYLLLTIGLITIGLSGCDNYVYTFNDQSIFSPPELFTGYSLSDSSLQSCTEQAIFDQKVTEANQLTQLNCSNAGISSLSGLEIFTGLTHINFDKNNLVGIKPLLFLPKLEVVSLKANQHLDCSDARQLRNQIKGVIKLPGHCDR